MHSNDSSTVEQGALLLTRAEPMLSVPIETVVVRKSLLAAINLCIDLSGLDEKEIYIPLGVDPGHWSNLRKGKGHFPPDRINDLMTLCRNEAPLIWLAHSRGYGLVVLKTESERRAEAAEKRATEAEMKVRVLMEAINGRGIA